MVERAAHPTFGELTAALEETNAALRAGDLGRAEHAVDLLRASGMDSNDSLRALRGRPATPRKRDRRPSAGYYPLRSGPPLSHGRPVVEMSTLQQAGANLAPENDAGSGR